MQYVWLAKMSVGLFEYKNTYRHALAVTRIMYVNCPQFTEIRLQLFQKCETSASKIENNLTGAQMI